MAKAEKDVLSLVGGWAFLIGVLLAIAVGLFYPNPNAGIQIALIVIGLIVGLLNVTAAESTPFLMSGAVLIIASSLGQVSTDLSTLLPLVAQVLSMLLLIFVPATIVVAVKNVLSLGRI